MADPSRELTWHADRLHYALRIGEWSQATRGACGGTPWRLYDRWRHRSISRDAGAIERWAGAQCHSECIDNRGSCEPAEEWRGAARTVLTLIPMTRPEIITGPSGPAVTPADFTLVTAANPATAGETLILYATGLGPTRPGVDPGKPFTPGPQQVVNSPVEVTANGAPAQVFYAGGFPGSVNGYHVSFRLPPGTALGEASLRVTAASIPGPEVKIAVKILLKCSTRTVRAGLSEVVPTAGLRLGNDATRAAVSLRFATRSCSALWTRCRP